MNAISAPIAAVASWADLFDVAHAVMLFAGGVGYLWLWRRHRFWLPRYAHVLAIGGTLVAGLAVWLGGSPEPGQRARELTVVLLMPFLIYFLVVFFGAAEAARERHERSKRED